MGISLYRSLSPQEKGLVAIGVLLDGREAGSYLEFDEKNGTTLARIATELSQLEAELRMPLLGTLLRMAVEEMK